MSEGLAISLAETPEAVNEERRLLYVGVTRAENTSSCPTRTHAQHPAGETESAPGCLDGIWPETENISRATRNRRRAKDAALKFQLDHPDDLRLLESLKAWRKAQSAEERKPAYLILVDRVLHGTSRPPTHHPQLGQSQRHWNDEARPVRIGNP